MPFYMYLSSLASLVAYFDANWGGFPTTCRSTLGYCVFLGDNRGPLNVNKPFLVLVLKQLRHC